MPLAPGTRLGPYEITAQIGVGGMGEVYQATDTKLKRQVAIKVLPESVAGDKDRLARFQREAEVLASLNHPHIAAIYGLEDADGGKALVMELVEGPTLADRIAQGAIPVDEAIAIARQIAEALEAAHEQGIIHRDLKPANVKVREDGTVKVLDFGLAKALEPVSASSPDISHSPTLTSPALSQLGTILGTAAYMSPEQARGEAVDARADVWAFGVVLFEMLTGRRLFAGATVSDVLASVMKDIPDWSSLPSGLPWPVRRMLRRCLEKDRKARLRHIGDAHLELVDVRADGGVAERDGKPSPWRERWAWGIAAVAGTVALSLGLTRDRPSEPGRTTRFVLDAPPGAAYSSWRGGLPVVSPDGRLIAFSAQDEAGERLWVRSLDSLEAHPLVGTGGILSIFWSPDSRSMAFQGADARLKRIGLAGGTPQTLYEGVAATDSGTWNDDGVILVSLAWSPIHRVPAVGGTPQPLTRLDPERQELWHEDPQFLPDGQHFLFYVRSREAKFRGTYVASLAAPDDRQLVLPGAKASYAAPGFLLFAPDGSLVARRFDAARLAVTGEQTVVAEQLEMLQGAGLFSASSNGVLVYRAPSTPDFQLGWFDRRGNEIEMLSLPEGARSPELSPDGERMAFERYDPATGERDVWLFELARGVASRFTFDPANDSDPVWSPDGTQILFSSSRRGYPSLYRKGTSGSLDAELVHEAQGGEWPMSWSSDGRYVAYNRWSSDTSGGRLWFLSLSEGGQVAPLLSPEFEVRQPQFSPDAKWISYTSDESGEPEVYVERFPGGGDKLRISSEGGSDARWRGDGNEPFYLAPDRTLMAVQLKEEGGTLRPSRPQALFRTRSGGPLGVGLRFNYAVRQDGQRFLIQTATEQSAPAPIVVVLNWFEELKRRVPTN